jgi:hypothetical protein
LFLDQKIVNKHDNCVAFGDYVYYFGPIEIFFPAIGFAARREYK